MRQSRATGSAVRFAPVLLATPPESARHDSQRLRDHCHPAPAHRRTGDVMKM